MQLQAFYLIFFGVVCVVCNGEQPIKLKWNSPTSGTTLHNFGELSFYCDTEDNDTVARLIVEIPRNSNASLLFSYQTKQVSSGSQVPNVIYNVPHYIIAKTLCPFTKRENLTIQLRSYEQVKFNLTAWKLEHFHLRANTPLLNKEVFIVQPQFFEYTFEKNNDDVIIEITSKSSDCMIVSLQEKRCPVFDENNNVLSTGTYLTMTTSASLSVSRRDFKGNSFYVVLVKSKDDDCNSAEFQQANSDPSAGKTFNITVKDAGMSIAEPLLFITLVYASITAVSIGYVLFDQETEKKQWRSFLQAQATEELEQEEVQENLNDNDSVQISISSYDELLDVNDLEVVRRRQTLTVYHLCTTPWEKRNDKFTNSLITVALFYALPVVQFVLDHVENVHKIGNLDLCWFNFRCAKSVTIGSVYFFAFNNILSNVGYVILGVLYLLMTKERDRRYQDWIQLGQNFKDGYGLPQHPGISYAIGVAVIMEGVMSMSYHVCPTAANFQFDTAFMFVCAILGMMKIYQLRHPDMVVNAHKTFCTLAVIIFFISIGVNFNISFQDEFNPFWVVYALCYPLLMIVISTEFYFKGFRFNFQEIRNSVFHSFLSSRWCSCIIPRQKGRFFFLGFANFINFLFVVFGLIRQPKDFASFLLFPLILNLLLYLMYYIVMKFANGERLDLSVLLFLALSAALWAVSLFYFNNNVSDWALHPAESRVINKDCTAFGYFDNHDVWHLCSSLAIFISFTLIDRLDDDLRFTKRCNIPVF